MILFVFDRSKSESNSAKHGIDFVAAQALWDDPRRVVLPARTSHEIRWLMVARIANQHWAAIFTIRGSSTRIISVRPARRNEVALYDDLA